MTTTQFALVLLLVTGSPRVAILGLTFCADPYPVDRRQSHPPSIGGIDRPLDARKLGAKRYIMQGR